MRVIAGTARSLPLKTVEGLHTRPTTDRIKETLFNMLHPYLLDCRFLDLFAGSGAIGIEALSRGAKEAVFVENNRKACDCVKENLKFTKLADRAQVHFADALSVLHKLEGSAVFGIVFLDPPYDMGLEQEVLAYLEHSELVDEDTIIILETSVSAETDWIEDYGFTPWKIKTYKTNKHLFISRTGE